MGDMADHVNDQSEQGQDTTEPEMCPDCLLAELTTERDIERGYCDRCWMAYHQ